ncbi:HVA22-like protein h [Vanrija pseudolonga]|uniref:Protein YOP1 n=1 Tax=Vanrija pseudolonga TaxID=143232 RepID=A0AAF1BI92_9TREE|nr:HVA22-like protein h [Vanrija pseudolonga]
MPFLVTRLINVTGVFLYPAYASYKALQARPQSSPEAQAAVERWLQYWAVVGAWATIEGAVGFLWSWIPFYTIIKTLVFLYLTLPSTYAAPYVYRTFLAPLFAEHEPAIDAFLGDIRAKTTGAAGGTVGWLWETVRKALGLTQDQAAYAAHAAGIQPPPHGGAAPPPYASRPGAPPGPPPQQQQGGGGAFGLMSGLAKQYLPGAIAAASSALGATGAAQAQGYRVPNVSNRSFSAGSDTPSAPAGGQFHGETDTSALHAHAPAAQRNVAPPSSSRTPSDASLASGSGSAANLRASGYDEIRREEAEGATPDPSQRRASGSSWLKWGGGGAAPPGAPGGSGKDKAE